MPGDIPHPTEHTSWPSWFYPSGATDETAAELGQVFHSADDVPEGWAADWRAHGANLDREPPEPPAGTELSRNELKSALTSLSVEFKPTAAKAELQKLLAEATAALEAKASDGLEHLRAELTARDVEFSPDDDEAELRSLLDEAEEAERAEAAL